MDQEKKREMERERTAEELTVKEADGRSRPIIDEIGKAPSYFKHPFQSADTIFPIDYSEASFANAVGCSRYLVKQHLTDAEWYRDCLDDLLYYDTRPGVKRARRNEKAAVTVPLESFDLLESYVRIKVEKEKSRRGDPISEEEILPEVFRSVHRGIREKKTGETFFGHTMYRSPAFSSVVMSDLWEEELEKRCKVLRTLAAKTPPTTQIVGLEECLQSLDRVIWSFQDALERGEQDERETGSRHELVPILESLTGERVVVPRGRSMYFDSKTGATTRHEGPNGKNYWVPDLQVETESETIGLQEAFKRMAERSADEMLRAASREAYMSYLSKGSRPSDFQNTFESVQEYLSALSGEFSQRELDERVKERYRQYLLPIIRTLNYDSNTRVDAPSEQYGQLKYGSGWLDRIIKECVQSHIQRTMPIIQEIQYLGAAFDFGCHEVRGLGKDEYDLAQMMRENPFCLMDVGTREQVAYDFTLLRDMWREIYGESPEADLFPEASEGLDESCGPIAELAKEDCSRAAQWFGLPGRSNNPGSAAEFESSLQLIVEILGDEHGKYAYHYFMADVVVLLRRFYVLLLKTIVDRDTPRIVDSFLKLQEIYKNRP